MTTLHERIRALVASATEAAVRLGVLTSAVARAAVALERPRQAAHGDLASNVAFVLAKTEGRSPRAVAEALAPLLRTVDDGGLLVAVEVAGPGFLNLTLSAAAWQAAVSDVLQAGETYGRSGVGGRARVLLEFVSANPTGPMHVGHGRGAVLGDALARVMRAADFDVTTEYYVNNVGNQVAKLGESVWCWMREPTLRRAALAVWASGEPVPFPQGFPAAFPEDGYRGSYIADTAERLAAAGLPCPDLAWTDDAAWRDADPPSGTGRADNRTITLRSWQEQLARIRADLETLEIRFDSWFSERRLHGLDGPEPSAVAAVAERLVAADWAYEDAAVPAEDEDAQPVAGKAIFFRGTSEAMPKAFRDGKDRVIVRGDGRPTYFAADIAYHDHKLERGFDHLINVLGADHHGYVARLKGVIQALGLMRADPRWTGERLEVLLVQMVALLRDGKPVPMGKRSGEFVTLRDVIDEVTTAEPSSGRDAVRFLFLLRKADAQLDFDLEVARRTSLDNPVYYVQYAHARLCSILERAQSLGRLPPLAAPAEALALADERELALACAELPEVVARAARSREPHLIAYYLTDLARAFNGYYSRNKQDARVISNQAAETTARLQLVRALRQVFANGLGLLGVSAPERMVNLGDGEA